MKLEDQVVSLELAKKLKELGVRQDGVWGWFKNTDRTRGAPEFVLAHPTSREPIASAFTVAELGDMLPDWVSSYRVNDTNSMGRKRGRWWCELGDDYKIYGHSQVEVMGQMLLHLLERGLIKKEDLR